MDLYELFYTPIDELYERGILEDRIEHNVKQNTITFECCLCHKPYTETWARNNPDKLSRGLWCTYCHLPTMFLKEANPHTIYYRSHAMSHGNFGEDVSGECWQCGKKEDLHTIAFSTGDPLVVCRIHVKPFAKAAIQAIQRKQIILAGLFDDILSRSFDPHKNYSLQQVRGAYGWAGLRDEYRQHNQAELNAAMEKAIQHGPQLQTRWIDEEI